MTSEPSLREHRRPVSAVFLGIGIALLATSPMLGKWAFAMIFAGIVFLAAAGVFRSAKAP